MERDQNLDAMVLAGDLLGCPDGFDTPEDAQRHEAKLLLLELFKSIEVPVLYILGNDDLVELEPPTIRCNRFTVAASVWETSTSSAISTHCGLRAARS
jgi:hypothetical protein